MSYYGTVSIMNTTSRTYCTYRTNAQGRCQGRGYDYLDYEGEMTEEELEETQKVIANLIQQGEEKSLFLLHGNQYEWSIELNPTYQECLFGQRGQDYNKMYVEFAEDVAQIIDNEEVWYADGPLIQELLHTRISHKGDTYNDFWTSFRGHDEYSEKALPLKARFAHGKHDLTSQQGRELALEKIFLGNTDQLTFACMLLDMEID